jgi:oxygen-independent coproporphyrinogen-3 oxidase
MYALPGQTLAQLHEDLDTALALGPPHLSIYHLTIEPNTVFAKYPPPVPEDDLAYAMLDRLTELTGAPACSATRCRPLRGPATAAGTT